jgi:hypothetical protein
MKRIILFFALIFPIGIFIFLRYFGKNEFTIPVYYSNELPDSLAGCKKVEVVPYSVPESTLNKLGWKGNPAIITNDTLADTRKNLLNLHQDFESDKLDIIVYAISDSIINTLCRCELLLEKPWTTVLIDKERRIRGYYSPNTREEIDRLEVEIKILLNKY